jgi:uncharacterized lipoprotein YmbA
MTTKHCIFFLLIACGLTAPLAGCFGTSPTSRFYTLAPLENRNAPPATGLDTVVSIGPVTIPEYLDRKQVVTRSGGNEIFLAEFDRWGGSLDGEITRALVAGLADRLNPRHIAVFPWRSTPIAHARMVYRIPVSISRFDGALGEKVVLDATWEVFVKGEKHEECLLAKETTITEKVDGKSYDALVAAMGKAVEKLAKEMSDGVIAAAGKSPI